MTTAISILLALLFAATAAGKLTGQPMSLAMRDHLGIAAARWQQIGLLELAGAAGVLIGLALRPLGIAAGRWVWAVFAGRLGVPPRPVTPVLAVTLLVPATIVLANLVAAVPARLAARTQPAAALRTE